MTTAEIASRVDSEVEAAAGVLEDHDMLEEANELRRRAYSVTE